MNGHHHSLKPKAKGDHGEGLYVRRRTNRRDSYQSNGKSRSKSQGGRLKCYICQSGDHLKRNCMKNNCKKSTCYIKKYDQPSSSGSIYDGSKVMMVMSVEALLDWIMDSGGSYHMTPRECKTRGISKMVVQWQVSLMLVLKKKTVLRRFGIKDWDISARRDYMCWKSRSCLARRVLTFWAKATCTVAYLINRSPSTAIEKNTPMEMWSGHPREYGLLRVFGYVAYSHVKKEEEDTHEPLTYQEVVSCEDSSKWKAAMKEEIDSLRKNNTWELVDHPVGQKFAQRACINYNEESHVVRHTSIQVILALTACKDYELEQLDVKTTFLQGNLEEVIYMRQPPAYGHDDMLVACKSKDEIRSTKSLLKREFDMKELNEAKKIFGMEIIKDRSCKILRVSQSGYLSMILNNFRVDNGKSVKIPLNGHFKMYLKDFSIRDCDIERMSKALYANAVRSLLSRV
nr:zinc finger, CCHC-type [Tanacetum cinerariifolium]